MISGRRPRRPDGRYYRERRKTGRTGLVVAARGTLSPAAVAVGMGAVIVAVVLVFVWRS